MNKQLILGTAHLGSKFSIATFSQMYETFMRRGFYLIDTAMNYPIDGNPANFKGTLKLLQEVKLPSKSIFVKVGGSQNAGNRDLLLNQEYLKFIVEHLQESLSESLFGIGVHWDDRDDLEQIDETLEILGMFQSNGLAIGFSGVKNSEAYKAFFELRANNYIVQHNALNSSSVVKNRNALNWFYGVNKLKEREFASIQLTRDFLMADSRTDGVIIGPTNLNQLNDWLCY